MKSYNHTPKRVFVISLLLGAMASETAWAVPVTMPDGSTVWMELSANACDSDGDADCLGSNQLGANPPNGIPLTTFNEGNGTWVTGFAEAYPNQARSYLSSYSGSFMYISMLDSYTVHGTAAGPFNITVHLDVTGTAASVVTGPWHQLNTASVQLEIGTWNPSTAPALGEQFRVTPFDASTLATQGFATQVAATPFSHAVNVSASHTRSVGVGDVFDLAYGINSALGIGTLDLLNTAVISFDLPQGVYLTSAQGGTFGAPVPVPAVAWLFVSGLVGLIAVPRQKRH